MSDRANTTKNILFIIDPQNDFHPGGSLAVPGSNEDSGRIANFIVDNASLIDEIYVSLDSHHRIHIAHGVFWNDQNGEHPPPFTLIKHQDVISGKWTPVNPDLLEYAKHYTKSLEDKGRFIVCIWPEHCLIGTAGHAVVPVLNDALQEWVKIKMKPVEYIHKGMNCLTEMYSALAAEVPLQDDPTTSMNLELLKKLNTADNILICGEAKSHCVNYTMRDLAAHWTKEQSALVLLSDCTSAVPGFEDAAAQFEHDMKALGCRILKHNEIVF
ncbi:MAG: hypothetical protein CMK59_06480 [Proteobacteria bacterium]|nr:hypothetical protein [Pseudomonadota bacterium]